MALSTRPAAAAKTSWKWGALLFLVVAGLLLWANHRFLTASGRYVNEDFMSYWLGGRALLEGVDPYDAAVWIPLRERYGSSWFPDERPPQPPWTTLLFLPISALSLNVGAAAWLAISQVALSLSVWLLLCLGDGRRPSPAAFGLVLLVAFTFRGTLVTLQNGQLGLALLFVITLFLVLVRVHQPFWAGIALAFLALKPNAFVLLAPLVGLWLIWRRQWQILAGAAAGVIGLVVVSLAVEPGWLSAWLSVRGKTEVAFLTPTVWGLAYELTPAWWPLVGLLLAAAVTAVTGWLMVTHTAWDELVVVPLAVAASLLVTPYAWDYEHTLLLVSLVLLLPRWQPRPLAWARWLFLAWVWPWFLFWIANQRNSGTLTFMVPLLVGVIWWLAWRRGGVGADGEFPVGEPAVTAPAIPITPGEVDDL